MASQDEIIFLKTTVDALGSIPITYPDDFQPHAESIPRKIPVFQTDIPPPPERKVDGVQALDSITLTIKSLKPAHTFTVSAHPTDSISSLKQKIATLPRAPPADWQRLLLKGKALTDSKLLKEYNVEDGAILNLTIKPGSVWTGDLKEQGHTNTTAPEGDASHRPVPSLVLSEDPTPTGSGVPSPSSYPMRPSTPSASNAYKTVMTSPAFWERLHQFLLKEFKEHGEAETAFEVFLAASKEVMTAQDIAKIRDVVGVVGMAGT